MKPEDALHPADKAEEPSVVEYLTPGLTFERYYNGKIIAFRFKDISQHSIATWADRCIVETLALKGELAYCLTDYSECKHFHVSPYLRQRATELSKQFKDVAGYNAILLPRTAFMQIAMLFLRMLTIESQTRVVANNQEGLTWLQDQIERNAVKKK